MCTRLLLLCVALCAGCGGAVDYKPPPSPCPGVFRYQYERAQWIGHITALIPKRSTGVKMVVSLYIADVLPPEFPGGLHLTQASDVIKKGVLWGGRNTIDYRLVFPVQRPMPTIDRITVNDQVICDGPRVKGKIVTKTSFSNNLEFTRPSYDEKEHEFSDLHLGYYSEILNNTRDLGKKYKSLPKDDRTVLRKNHEQLDPMFKPPPSSSHTESTKFPKSNSDSQKEAEPLSKEVMENSPEIEFSLSSNDQGDDIEITNYRPNFSKGEFNPNNNPETFGNEDYHMNIPAINKLPSKNQGRTSDVPKHKFNPKDDTEILNGKPLPKIFPDLNQIRPNNPGPNFNRKNPDIPKTELNINNDAEVFDSKLFPKNVPKTTTASPKSNAGVSEVYISEFNPKDDVEMLNSAPPQKKVLTFKLTPPKTPSQIFNDAKYNIPKKGFNPKNDVEMLNNTPPKKQVPTFKLTPPKTPSQTFNDTKYNNPKKEFNPKDDVEMLNNSTPPQKKVLTIKPTPPKSPSRTINDATSNIPKKEFNPKDDVEMLNSTPPKKQVPAFKLTPPKSPSHTINDATYNTPKKEFSPKDDAEMLNVDYIKKKKSERESKVSLPKTRGLNLNNDKPDIIKSEFNPLNDVEIFNSALYIRRVPETKLMPDKIKMGNSVPIKI